MKVPPSVKSFFDRAGTVIHSRAVYSKIQREGGPEAQQLKADIHACLRPAIKPLHHAVKRRDVGAVFDAAVAVWKAQGKVTDAILHHQKVLETTKNHGNDLFDSIFEKAEVTAQAEPAAETKTPETLA
mgnify:FL=1